MVKRDWLAAADRVAHLMDGIQREMVEVKFGSPWNMSSSIYLSFDFKDGNEDHRDRGRLTYVFKTRAWDLTIDCKLDDGEASVKTADVPQWLIEQVPETVKAMIMTALITADQKADIDADIPF